MTAVLTCTDKEMTEKIERRNEGHLEEILGSIAMICKACNVNRRPPDTAPPNSNLKLKRVNKKTSAIPVKTFAAVLGHGMHF
jgi:hypothetical protein